MADKKSITLTDVVSEVVTKSGKNAGKTLYTHTGIDGNKYLSYEKFPAGAEYYYLTEKETEYNGNKQISRWISLQEYKPNNGGGKFFPKQPDKVAMLKEAGAIVDCLMACGVETKIKSRAELWERIDREFKEIEGRVK